MTMPHLMNCPHQDHGWCLACVKTLNAENDKLAEALRGVAQAHCHTETCDMAPWLEAVEAALADLDN